MAISFYNLACSNRSQHYLQTLIRYRDGARSKWRLENPRGWSRGASLSWVPPSGSHKSLSKSKSQRFPSRDAQSLLNAVNLIAESRAAQYIGLRYQEMQYLYHKKSQYIAKITGVFIWLTETHRLKTQPEIKKKF